MERQNRFGKTSYMVYTTPDRERDEAPWRYGGEYPPDEIHAVIRDLEGIAATSEFSTKTGECCR